MWHKGPDGSDDAPCKRNRWVIPPQVGRLVPLTLHFAERELDATVYAVTTGGLSQKQIDETPLWDGFSSPFSTKPLNSTLAFLRRVLSKARRHI